MSNRVYLLYGYHTQKKRDFNIRLTVEQAREYKKTHENVVLFISKEERTVYKELA